MTGSFIKSASEPRFDADPQYWEHCGMMDSDDYVARWRQKLDWYVKELGISIWSETNPSGRLIVTEETKASGFDSHAINGLIQKLFG